MLVVYAMALDLQDRPGHVELALDALKRTLPQKAFEFFAPRVSSLDTPLDGSESGSQPPIPDGNDFNLERHRTNCPRGHKRDAIFSNRIYQGEIFPKIAIRHRE